MRFELQELEYFLAVANAQSFTKAAADSHVTQPALSRKIQEMEKQMGTVLLERTTRKVRLTEAGEVLKRYANVILETCEEAELAVLRCANRKDHALELGYGSRAQFEYMMKLIHVLHGKHPEISINVTHGTTYERLYLGQLDAALVMEGTVENQDWVDYECLDDSGLSVYFPKDRFPTEKKDITVAELADCHFLIPERHTSEREIPFTTLHDLIIQKLQQRGIPVEAFHTGHDAQEFCTRILTNHELGIMPDSSRIVTGELIGSLPLRECRSGFGIALAWNRQDSGNIYIKTLRTAAGNIRETV